MGKQKLLIVGAGSVGKFIAYNISSFTEEFDIYGFLDDDKSKHNCIIAGFKVLGDVSEIINYADKDFAVVWGIAFPKVKSNLFQKYKHLNFYYPSFISNKAWLSEETSVGMGCIIYPGCHINYETTVDDFVVMNMNCAIGHNCHINSFTSLAPGVNLGGNTVVGKLVEMGIGSSTLQSISIGNNTVIGGGAVVTKSLPENCTAVGIPAKSIKIHS